MLLRLWTAADSAPFAELNADPEVMAYFPTVLPASQSQAFIDRVVADLEQDGFGLWALEIDGAFAGFVGLQRIRFASAMQGEVEVGWRMARWAWGRGYATEAATVVLNDAFGRCRLDAVYSFTTATNARSRAVMERLGMQRRHDLDFDHPSTPGWWGAPHVVYSLDAAAWSAAQH